MKRLSKSRKLRRARSSNETRSTPFQDLLKYRASAIRGKGAVPITPNTAVCISAVFASVRILSGLMSSLPLRVFERKGSGRDPEVGSHPVAEMLRTEVNPEQTPAIFKEEMGRDYWLFGNSYAEQAIDVNTGETFAAVNHHASNVEPFRDRDDPDPFGRPKLKYRVWDGSQHRIVDRSMMIHSPALGFDGMQGASVVHLAAQSMGIALSGDNLAAQFNTQGAKPFLIVSTPEYLDDEPYHRLKRDIDNNYRGDDAFGSMLLEGGAAASTLSIPFKDAQFLESRKFQGEEIAARWFGLPPHLAGYLDRAHFNNVEEQDRALLVFTLQPAITRIEEEWNRKVFRGNERGRYYVKFNVDALLRPQLKERYEAHKTALMAGFKTVNEIRELEDLPPVAGGDILARPASVFGNDPTGQGADNNATPADSGDSGDDTERTARGWRDIARKMVVATLDSLQAAEIHHSERFAKHRDPVRVREWYQAQEQRAIDKLSSIGVDDVEIRKHYNIHCDQVLHALKESNVPAAVESTVAGWNGDAERLADALLN